MTKTREPWEPEDGLLGADGIPQRKTRPWAKLVGLAVLLVLILAALWLA